MKTTIILIAELLCLPLITIGQNQNWTRLDDFDGLGRLGAFSFVINNKGYVGAGVSSNGQKLNDFWEYDPATDAWRQRQNASGIPRTFGVGFAIGNKGYMGAGDIGSSGNFVSSNDFYEYDPVMDVWTIKQNIGTTGRQNAAAFVIGSKGYVAFGYRDAYIYDHTVYEYDPATNIWTQKGSFDSDKLRESPASFTINGKAYVAGGYNNTSLYGTYYKDIWEYNPLSDSWTFKALFPSNVIITEPIGFSSGNLGYIFGDDISANSDVNFLKYDPSNNTVSILPNHPNEFVYPTGLSLCQFAYSVTGSNGREVWRRFLPEISISGSSLVCASGSTFTLNNLPSGFSVTWQATPSNLFAISSGTGSAATLSAANNSVSGQGTITFTLNNPCGNPVQVSKPIWVGNYHPTGVSSYNSNCSGGNFNYLNTSLSSACTANTPIYFSYRITDSNYSNFVFTPVSVPSGATWSSSGGNLYMTVYTPPSQGSRSATIALSATGPCGTYNVNFTSTAVNYYSGGYYYSFFPNPASETLTIQQTYNMEENSEVDTLLKEGSSNTRNFRLYDFNNYKVVLEGSLSRKTEIDVSKLDKGRYILKIQINKNKEETHHIIVE